MTDTKELLQKITALRARLNSGGESEASNPLRAMEKKVQHGSIHNALIESALRCADPGLTAPPVLPTTRLTARGARLLRQGRELLQALRKIADDGDFQDAGILTDWHREGMAMLDVLLRTVQAMPASVSMQLRLCDGLEVVLAAIEERIDRLCVSLAQRKHSRARIDELADYLRALASGQVVTLTPLQGLADLVLDEARAGRPLRFLHASPADPSRFAAAHGLTVAQVLARLIAEDPEWRAQAQLAVMAALVHDVGMTRVPAEVLLKETPLDTDERRLIEKHAVIAADMLAPLWPGGGWPIEAATCHHERKDGTGYPLGRQEIHLAPFVHLLAVCDVYAALCAPRPHRRAFDTRTALTEVLLLAERGFLQQTSAERLLLLSFYPVGSAVELSDGAVGVVVRAHAGDVGLAHPDRPIVLLAAHANGQADSWPIVVDLMEQKHRSIVRALDADEKLTALGGKYPQWI
ncbi:MAG: HD domain-containing protein [Planctomycetes bacterium]|nr:HD domain-containing protein [Planctomycetota bacterium]